MASSSSGGAKYGSGRSGDCTQVAMRSTLLRGVLLDPAGRQGTVRDDNSQNKQ